MYGKKILATVIAMSSIQAVTAQASSVETALTNGKVMADFRLRYETNDTDNTLEEGKGLTLHSRIGYESAELAGFKVLVENEMVHAMIDDYAPETAGYNTIADPTGNEINRAQISYSNGSFGAVLGRQRIILDNARFVGNVGWRQNEQTYDGVSIKYAKDALTAQYAYIKQVNDITFKDTEVKDHLLNLSYKLDAGTLTAYGYKLSNDDVPNANNGSNSDTFGLRFAGATPINNSSLIYSAEYASQKTTPDVGTEFSATYMALELGAKVSGVVLALGSETLGSDDGAYGFQTPLATKHAFNGWADKFLATPASGLSDTYAKVAGAVKGVNLVAMYHTFEADEGGADLGSELDLVASMNVGKDSQIGIKSATYSKGDSGVDTDKIWIWAQTRF